MPIASSKTVRSYTRSLSDQPNARCMLGVFVWFGIKFMHFSHSGCDWVSCSNRKSSRNLIQTVQPKQRVYLPTQLRMTSRLKLSFILTAPLRIPTPPLVAELPSETRVFPGRDRYRTVMSQTDGRSTPTQKRSYGTNGVNQNIPGFSVFILELFHND